MTTALLTAARAVARRFRRRPEPPSSDPWIAKGIREGWVRPAKGDPRLNFRHRARAVPDRPSAEILAEDRGE